MEKEIHNCPTCGSEVIVEGNTTQYYVPLPVWTAKNNKLREELESRLIAEIKKYNPSLIIPPKEEQKTLRRMGGNIWADENNFQYEEIDGNFIKTTTAR